MKSGNPANRRIREAALSFLASALAAAVVCTANRATADTPVCGDVNRTSSVTSTDALLILRRAVGQEVDILCPGVAAPLKTGQTSCYDPAGDPVSCTGRTQDASLGFGSDRSFVDNGNGTITDLATGLMWEKLSNDGGVHDVDAVYTWADAFSTKIAALNSAGFGGFNDWRLPNRFELQTLVNLGAHDPATHTAFRSACGAGCTVLNCSCTASDYYWTSTSWHEIPNQAWQVLFEVGHEEWSTKSSTARVRAVR